MSLALGVGALGLAPLPAAAVAPTTSVPLTTVQGAAASPPGASSLGAVPDATPLTFGVVLGPRDPGALTAFATAVSTPGNPAYRHFLARGAYAARFGPTPATVTAVERTLESAGLRISSLSANHTLLSVTGTAAQAEHAFSTRLVRYRFDDGRTASATAGALRLPTTVASAVTGVIGLDNLVTEQPADVHFGGAGHAPASAPTVTHAPLGPQACAAATSDAADYGGLTDDEIASAYGVSGLYGAGSDGAGETVAIYELEPYNLSDIKAFDTCYFGTTATTAMLARLNTVPVDGGQQTGYGSGEAELDIDNVSAIAPGATIDVYEAPSTNYGAFDELDRMVSDDTAQVVTSSWGICEADAEANEPGVLQAENVVLEQGAAQGQAMFAAAGDSGSDDCAEHGSSPTPPVLSVDDPGSQPFVTSVGGTTIDDATNPPAERVWNDGAAWGAGGGGISDVWAMPSWQLDDAVPGLDNATVVNEAEAVAAAQGVGGGRFCLSDSPEGAAATACREVPDVSAQADEFTGAITIYYRGAWTTIGGTSVAAPLWASIVADIGSTPACQADGGIGFLNPRLYQLGANPTAYAASFNDITEGNNDPFGSVEGLYPATPGYSMAAGLGSPHVEGAAGQDGLAYELCSAPAPVTPTLSALAPSTVPLGGGTTVTVSGTNFLTGTTSQVAGVSVGGLTLSPASWQVVSATTLTFTAPPASALVATGTPGNGAGAYLVTVTGTSGASSSSSPGGSGGTATLTYVATSGASSVPSVGSVGPAVGSVAGGTVVTIHGSGFAPTTGVAFGGVAATGFTVVSPTTITATVPAYGGTTTCATANRPAVDVCQVQVAVTGPGGTSAPTPILAPYQGVLVGNASGVLIAPPGCDCEVSPAPTEFDYEPPPTITAVTTTTPGANGVDYASTLGDTVATIEGSGLDLLGLEWADLGDPTVAGSADDEFLSVTPTAVELLIPARKTSRSVVSVPVTVQTLASPNVGNLSSPSPAPSNAVPLAYAGTPAVTAVSLSAGPAVGGTTLTITGSGFTSASDVQFVDRYAPYGVPFSDATSFDLAVTSDTSITLTTPASNPGFDNTEVCTASGCSAAAPAKDTFTFYPPGNPVVTSSAPSSGPAAGGTTVTITGTGLGCATAVHFGTVASPTVLNPAQLLDCGSTSTVTALSPPGTDGHTVDLTVTTVEGTATGYGPSHTTSAATFTYSG